MVPQTRFEAEGGDHHHHYQGCERVYALQEPGQR